MSKLSFFIDESRDRYFVQPSLRIYTGVEENIEGIAKRIGFPTTLLEKINTKKTGYEKDLISFVQRKYLQNYHQLETKKEKLEIFFNENWKPLAKQIEELSERKLQNYNVHVSHFFDLASWYGFTITIPAMRYTDWRKSKMQVIWLVVLSHLHYETKKLELERYSEEEIHIACWIATYVITRLVFNEKIESCVLMKKEEANVLQNMFLSKKNIKNYFEKALEYISNNNITKEIK